MWKVDLRPSFYRRKSAQLCTHRSAETVGNTICPSQVENSRCWFDHLKTSKCWDFVDELVNNDCCWYWPSENCRPNVSFGKCSYRLATIFGRIFCDYKRTIVLYVTATSLHPNACTYFIRLHKLLTHSLLTTASNRTHIDHATSELNKCATKQRENCLILFVN